jgi:azurin
MTIWQTIFTAALALAVGVGLAGCGEQSGGSNGSEAVQSAMNSQSSADSQTSPDAGQRSAGGESGSTGSTSSVPEAMKAFEDGGNVKEITIEGDDQMNYSIEQFSVKPGQMVRLTLEHVGSLPASAMGHNVVIIEQGEDFMEFTADANEQGANLDNDYLPKAVYDRVIAFTELVGGGNSTTVEFKAPDKAGKYPYLCTFPGHAAQMNGTMAVEDK